LVRYTRHRAPEGPRARQALTNTDVTTGVMCPFPINQGRTRGLGGLYGRCPSLSIRETPQNSVRHTNQGRRPCCAIGRPIQHQPLPTVCGRTDKQRQVATNTDLVHDAYVPPTRSCTHTRTRCGIRYSHDDPGGPTNSGKSRQSPTWSMTLSSTPRWSSRRRPCVPSRSRSSFTFS
jgi:hypothetical protein